jgi:cytochrome c peroxidase
MRFRVFVLVVAAAVFAGTVACDESLSSITGPTPNLEPTLSSIQKEIFDTTDSSGRLACINCHNGRNPFVPGNLTAGASYATLVGTPSVEKPALRRVAPGDPANSYFVHKLEGGPEILGTRMPRGTGPYLTAGQMLVIRRWIELGAAND